MSVSGFIETQLYLNPVNDLINTKIKRQNNVTIYGTVLALMARIMIMASRFRNLGMVCLYSHMMSSMMRR